MLFKMPEKRDWATDLIDTGVLPGYSNLGAYVGIGALRNSDVLAAISHVASNVARFPIVALDDDKNEVKQLKNLDYLLNKHPNATMSAYHWRFIMTVNAILTGDGFSRIIRDPTNNAPLELQYFPTSQVMVDDSNLNDIRYRFTVINRGQDSRTIEEPLENVVHFMFFTHDGVRGRSPLLSLGDEIGLQDDGIRTLRRFFKSGFKGGILTTKSAKLNKESRRKIREDFEYAQQGGNAGSPIILDSTTDYKPIEVDTNVLQLINSNNYSTAQIAKALHVPAYKLAVNSPNQSIKQLNEDFIRSDLPYYFRPITSNLELTMLTDRQRHHYHLDFDTRNETGYTPADVNTLVNDGTITPNEGRVLMGLPKADNGDLDRFQSSLNTVFLDQKEAYQASKAAKGGEKHDKSGTGAPDPNGADGTA